MPSQRKTYFRILLSIFVAEFIVLASDVLKGKEGVQGVCVVEIEITNAISGACHH